MDQQHPYFPYSNSESVESETDLQDGLGEVAGNIGDEEMEEMEESLGAELTELSTSTLAALNEFLAEKQKQDQYQITLLQIDSQRPLIDSDNSDTVLSSNMIYTTSSSSGAANEPSKVDFSQDLHNLFPEDWQMSQFWYDKESSTHLAQKILALSQAETDASFRIACISCPSLYHSIRAQGLAGTVHLFEYDQRFRAYGSDFKLYDYKQPLKVDPSLSHSYSLVVADPPFLSRECLEKVAHTIKYLMTSDAKIILCTGSVMEGAALELLDLRVSGFVPKHKNNLGNDFSCFTNFPL